MYKEREPGENPDDGEMSETTQPSRYITLNSSPGGLRPTTSFLGHGGYPQYWTFTSERGRNILILWNLKARLEGQSGARARDLRLSKQAALTTAPEPPPPFKQFGLEFSHTFPRLHIYSQDTGSNQTNSQQISSGNVYHLDFLCTSRSTSVYTCTTNICSISRHSTG